MTRYLAVYDVEWLGDVEYSLRAVEAVALAHRRNDAPATFFICGELLDEAGPRYRDLLAGGAFEVGSHTYSHYPLKQADGSETEEHLARVRDEILRTEDAIRRAFGAGPVGVRGPGGYYRGLQGQKRVLELLWSLGVRTLSTDARGPGETIPAPLTQPYWYAQDGFPDMLEVPAHDWHENVLKGHNAAPIAWPPPLPWGYPRHAPTTPAEEFAVYRSGVDWAREHDLFFYSPAMHPWSVYRFNAQAKTLDLLLSYVRERKMPMVTVTQLRTEFERLRE
jgi:peptidoglycan/xylan/chitin deacetylase (PgdA/CDA1 family)